MTIKIKVYGKEQNLTASKEVLNLLSSALDDAAAEQIRRGHDKIAEQYDIVSGTIYYALSNSGYYDK